MTFSRCATLKILSNRTTGYESSRNVHESAKHRECTVTARVGKRDSGTGGWVGRITFAKHWHSSILPRSSPRLSDAACQPMDSHVGIDHSYWVHAPLPKPSVVFVFLAVFTRSLGYSHPTPAGRPRLHRGLPRLGDDEAL